MKNRLEIKVGRKYRTRDGQTATIMGDITGSFYQLIGMIHGRIGWESWSKSGECIFGKKTIFDLIEEIPDPTTRSRYIIFSPDHVPFLTDDLETSGHPIIAFQVVDLEKLEWADSYIDGTAELEWKKLSE